MTRAKSSIASWWPWMASGAKLGVANRAEAGAVAHRLHLTG